MPLRTWASYNMRHCPVLRQEIRTGMSRMLWHPTQAQTGCKVPGHPLHFVSGHPLQFLFSSRRAGRESGKRQAFSKAAEPPSFPPLFGAR
jgi:hypothetical protein